MVAGYVRRFSQAFSFSPFHFAITRMLTVSLAGGWAEGKGKRMPHSWLAEAVLAQRKKLINRLLGEPCLKRCGEGAHKAGAPRRSPLPMTPLISLFP